MQSNKIFLAAARGRANSGKRKRIAERRNYTVELHFGIKILSGYTCQAAEAGSFASTLDTFSADMQRPIATPLRNSRCYCRPTGSTTVFYCRHRASAWCGILTFTGARTADSLLSAAGRSVIPGKSPHQRTSSVCRATEIHGLTPDGCRQRI